MLTTDPTTTAENELIPNKMHRKYHVVLAYRNRKPGQVRSISQLDSSMIGNLIVLKGIVIRTEEIKPRLSVATYTCDVCGA
jgi:DNA replication licensing factor MCM7